MKQHFLLSTALFFLAVTSLRAQRFLTDYDSTLFYRDTLTQVVRRFDNLYFSGYIQSQYQWAESKGASSYNGGNFSPNTNNRFMTRRARIKLDYILPGKQERFPQALFSFQIDGTERGVVVRDLFVRIYEPRSKNLSLTTGVFARPFGYELNLSSAFRETPERGRASQILMPTERDLGMMVTYESRKKNRAPLQVKWDAGVFNGQGLPGTTDFDSYKDFITRLSLKPYALSKTLRLSAGLSYLNGGWAQGTKYRYYMNGKDADFSVDSATGNVGAKAPRVYYGADVQLQLKTDWGKTEVRAEYWKGRQPGTAGTATSPGSLPQEPTYVRPFEAAFFYFLQHLGTPKWELMAKWDWWDPNTRVQGSDIGRAGSFLSATDVRYDTWGFGLTHYVNEHLKVLAYYDRVQNETTGLPAFGTDQKDDVFTLRLHFRF